MGFTIEEQIKCVRREIVKREFAYPHLIEQGRMSRRKADREIACMRSVLDILEEIEEKCRLI